MLVAASAAYSVRCCRPHCCRYPVSDRANAVQQFFDAAKEDPDLIQAPWLYMIESDYVSAPRAEQLERQEHQPAGAQGCSLEHTCTRCAACHHLVQEPQSDAPAKDHACCPGSCRSS